MATVGVSTSAAHSFLRHGAAKRSHSCCLHRNSLFGAQLDRKNAYYGLRRSRSRKELRFLVSAHLGQPEDVESALDLLAQAPDSIQNVLARVEGFLYTVADAAVATDVVTDSTSDTVQQVQQQSDWFSGVTTVMEAVLKVLEDGLSTLRVPYAYGFAIILLTVLVKALTFPLTKSQAESTISMQNLQPKLKAIQQRYAGDQERIQMETARLYKQAGVNPLAGCLPTLATLPVWIGLYRALSNVANEGLLNEGFFWIPSLSGPTTIAARQSGTGISWLFPFVDGHPPLGWGDTLAYLVLPVLLIISQYVSMQLMQPPQTDPSQKSMQVVLKFLPLMIGYFALSVPSGLSLYWLTNNILSTGQQVWLRKLGGAKPVVAKGGGEIISAGQAKRSAAPPPAAASATTTTVAPTKEGTRESRRGERFKQLKASESKRKAERAERVRLAAEATKAAEAAKTTSTERQESEKEGDLQTSDDESSSDEGSVEELFARSANGAASNGGGSPNKSKRSKRRRSV